MHDPLDLRDLLADELAQRRESGHDVSGFERPIRAALVAASGPTDPALEALLGELELTARVPDWPYDEPAGLSAILEQLPAATDASESGPDLADRLRGAWLGRCAGCTLGKPVEGLSRTQLREFLAATQSDPRDGYLPGSPELAERFGLKEAWSVATHGNIRGAPRDDDIDYTMLGLQLLEQHGPTFEQEHVTANLLLSLPYLRVYTAERVAYRNLVHGLRPPETAGHRNPYREWIGALIRADIYGYVSPGRPRQAARLAYRDATTSHTANGIYGAMWAAALVSEALVRTTAADALVAALRHVPPRSRLAEALERTIALHASGATWEDAIERLSTWYAAYSWVHAIPNVAAVSAGLLWGEGDLGSTLGLTVLAGLDTDSAAATAGSVFGALHGAAALPAEWLGPLEDRARSAIMGFDGARISDLAARTLALVSSGAAEPRGSD